MASDLQEPVAQLANDIDGWDLVEIDPWNFAKFKSPDRRSTVLVKQISLADGGDAYRVVLYHAERPHDMDGEWIGEQPARDVDEIANVIAAIEEELGDG